jgi:hypothetical protein
VIGRRERRCAPPPALWSSHLRTGNAPIALGESASAFLAVSRLYTLAVNHETHRRPWLSRRGALGLVSAAHTHQNLT